MLFVVAGAGVWFAGVRLAVDADALAERTGFDQAFLGVFLLAGATELPELATSITAAGFGDAALATNNLFGGIVLQTAVLAVADCSLRRGALTFFAPSTQLLLQGLGLVVLLGFALAALIVGELVVVAGVGLWSLLLGVGYVVFLALMTREEETEHGWKPLDIPDVLEEEFPPRRPDASMRAILTGFAIASVCVLVAGIFVVRIGEALAVQTGIGSSFVGAVLISATTSLPELSTTLTAVRIGAYRLAVANIFGSNAIMLLLFFVADVAYRPGALADAAGPSTLFGAAMGILVTAVYLIGLVERRDKSVLRMGYDSFTVVVLYLASLGGFYVLRGG